ncbi:MAG: FAD/NAD(P)-binding protein [Phycisphaerales bacterium]
MSEAISTVAIIGAGFSGAMVAAHLLRSTREPLRVVLIESRGVIGRGLAYSTPQSRHVLNVPCSKMGAWPEDLAGFHRWASARVAGLPEGAFVSRGLYGQYIESELRSMADAAASGVELEIVHQGAVDVRWRGDRALVELHNRQPLHADHVVLAMGSGPARLPLPLRKVAKETDRVVSLPFAPGALDSIGADDRVMILGTGLTMYDTVIALRDQGHRGPVLAVSRRGRTPLAHAPAGSPPWASEWSGSLAAIGSVKGVVREVREACERGEQEGLDWRGVIDSMRAHLPSIWRSWSTDERVRFLKWAAPFWDAVRHRCAPEIAAEIDGLREAGVLRIERGRARSFWMDGDDVVVDFASIGEGGSRVERVDRVLVCAGPESDVTHWPNPLMKSLLSQGLVSPDPLRLGVRTDGPGRVLDRDGNGVEWLSLVGPLRKADLWENTAVPELRVGAAEAAKRVLERVGQSARAVR